MKQLILSAFLLLSVGIFAQDTAENTTELPLNSVELIENAVIVPTDTVSNRNNAQTVIVKEADPEQLLRINDIEKRLTAYYTYNRRSQNLIYFGTSMAILGVLLSNSDENAGAVLTIGGGLLNIFGAVIQLDSYKFLNFKPKKKEIKKMTYY